MENAPRRAFGSGQLYRVAWVLYLVMALAGGLWIGLRERAIPLGLFVEPGTWAADAGLGIAAGILLLALWELARRTLSQGKELEDRLAEVLADLDTGEAMALALLSGFAEEFFFRGAVQGSWGWLWAALLFAALHTGPGAAFRLWTVFAALAGLLLGALMEWRQALLAPILAHALVNLVNLRRLVARRGPETAEKVP